MRLLHWALMTMAPFCRAFSSAPLRRTRKTPPLRIPIGRPASDFYGDYLLIGQKVEDDDAYKGRAHIEAIGHHRLRLTRTINGVTTIEEGIFSADSVGNAAKTPLPKFNWKDKRGDGEMFCHVTSNFDNYPLLMCIRYYPQEPKTTPGLESYFPAAVYLQSR